MYERIVPMKILEEKKALTTFQKKKQINRNIELRNQSEGSGDTLECIDLI